MGRAGGQQRPQGTTNKKVVIQEIRRRARRGEPITSAAARKDWLYGAAARFCGSWRNAVELAGFDYDKVCRRPMRRDEVLAELVRLSRGRYLVQASVGWSLRSGAKVHFGSWQAALAAAGLPSERPASVWPPERVIAAIRERHRRGLLVSAQEVVEQNRALYVAGRRRFGSWHSAVQAAIPMLELPKYTRRDQLIHSSSRSRRI